MVAQQELNKIIQALYSGLVTQIQLGDFAIKMQTIDDNSKLLLSTQVYAGENFIPLSVRRCAKETIYTSPFSIPTSLTIDEQNFQIFLNYRGLTKDHTQAALVDLLEDFAHQADEWRTYLDEHDRNDLIHITVK